MDPELTSDEQTTETEATDADLIAAVREAGGTDSVDVAAEEEAAAAKVAEAAKPAPDPAKPAEETADPNEPKITALLRAREKAFAERQEAENYAQTRKQQAEAEGARIVEEARARAQAVHDAEIQRLRDQYRTSPTEAIRALGVPSQQIIDDVTREGTPEWQALKRMEAELAEAKTKAGAVDKVKADFDAYKQAQEQERIQAHVAQVKHTFLSTVASPEKAPYLHKRYDADEIFEKADRLAAQWRQAGIQFAHSDVAEYLEHESRKRLGAEAATPQQVSGASGNAPKVKANGSRTLSAANGSERRASPKAIHEMTDDEEREALIEAAREARRTLKAE